MKELFISMLKTDDEIQEYFIVKSVAIKVGANNKQYLDLLLGDSSGEVPSKKWDISDGELSAIKEIKDGDIVKVKAIVTSWNGQKQMKVGRIRVINEQDEINYIDFIKAAPEDPNEMYDYIYNKASGLKDKDLNTLCIKLLQDNKEKLMYYPAAQKNHHAQKSGLLYHIKRMLMSGESLCQVYTNLNVELVITGVIIHDIEKLNEIDSDELGISSGYSFEGQMLGHLIQGVKLIDRVAAEIDMPREKAIMLEHMILTHHYEPEYGSPKKPLFPEAEILHYLDMIDARMFDMQAALDVTEPGEFSDRVWTLDNRKLYKSSNQE
ncbi:MAG: HD domain-containing protein [Peptostreptococcaceae bacterium]|nr:HD domain-containing protein [Peptostreptococcaceae bacterium]